MLVVHIDVQVNSADVAEFMIATAANGAASLDEPGVLRFDVVQDLNDPAHFVFVEVYRDADAALAHKDTAHYARWRDTVAPMMARPRQPTRFEPVVPTAETGWISGR